MKKIALILVLIVFPLFVFVGCSNNKKNEDVLRIHIRANSNTQEDQNVKLKVRDCVIEYITPLIANCKNSNDVKEIIQNNLICIENIANDVLKSNGFEYTSCADIENEFFPSRLYSDVVFPADYYDALILKLGDGVGDNWWCVAYPPLCFVGHEDISNNIQYRSKLLDLINKYFGD
jgi:stage II sporulation protein R